MCSFRFQFIVPKRWRRDRPVCIHLAGTGDHVRTVIQWSDTNLQLLLYVWFVLPPTHGPERGDRTAPCNSKSQSRFQDPNPPMERKAILIENQFNLPLCKWDRRQRKLTGQPLLKRSFAPTRSGSILLVTMVLIHMLRWLGSAKNNRKRERKSKTAEAFSHYYSHEPQRTRSQKL